MATLKAIVLAIALALALPVLAQGIKQNLKVKSFVGTSRNAVMTQLWIAACMYPSGPHLSPHFRRPK